MMFRKARFTGWLALLGTLLASAGCTDITRPHEIRVAGKKSSLTAPAKKKKAKKASVPANDFSTARRQRPGPGARPMRPKRNKPKPR